MQNFEDLRTIYRQWETPQTLSKYLNTFFNSDRLQTLSHLYTFLGVDEYEFEKRKMENEEFRIMLTQAKNLCENWTVEHGFNNDKAFAKWFLERYHNKIQKSEQKIETSPTITVKYI